MDNQIVPPREFSRSLKPCLSIYKTEGIKGAEASSVSNALPAAPVVTAKLSLLWNYV